MSADKEQASRPVCKLTECQGKPRCRMCLAMDARYTAQPVKPDGEPVAWQLSNARVALSTPSSTMAAVYEQDGFLVALKVPYGPPFYSRTALIEAIDGAITKLLSPAPPDQSERIAALEAELELRRKSGSASERLHNLCESIREEADGSAFSREEWNRIDAENLAMRKRIAALEAALKQAGEALEYHMAQTRPIQQTIDAISAIKRLQQ